ncbi:MAG: hypothetical protein WC455_30175 [Dehalococcoidia bacterium]
MKIRLLYKCRLCQTIFTLYPFEIPDDYGLALVLTMSMNNSPKSPIGEAKYNAHIHIDDTWGVGDLIGIEKIEE